MNKTALITGAARNVGKGISRKLLSEGYVCILVDKDKEALASTATELKEVGAEFYEYVADIADPEQIKALLSWMGEKNLSADTLINNAAHESTDTLLDLSLEEMMKSYQTNLVGPFYLTSLLTKQWIIDGTKGNVIFLSSTHSHLIRTHPLYSSSKAAIEMFMKEATLEVAHYGIRVNAIAPGAVRDSPEPIADYRTPMGYCLQPQDVAEGVAFLLSDKARYITGTVLTIDGGYGITHTHHWLKSGKLPPAPEV